MEAQLWDSHLAYRVTGQNGVLMAMSFACVTSTQQKWFNLIIQGSTPLLKVPAELGQHGAGCWSEIPVANFSTAPAGVSAVMSRTVKNRKRELPFIQLVDKFWSAGSELQRTTVVWNGGQQQLVNLLLLAKRKYWEAEGTEAKGGNEDKYRRRLSCVVRDAEYCTLHL